MGLFKKKAPQEPVLPVNEVHDESTGTAADVEAVMKKYDRESNTRVWEGAPKWIISILMAVFSVYCIIDTVFLTTLTEIRLPEISEETVGALIYFFEYACGVSGYISGVNPFNQPGVEAYKKNMFRLLGKPGYEA